MQARSLLFDLWGDYIQHVGGEVWTSTLARYAAEFGIHEPTLRQALSRMTRQGWLQVRKVHARSCYSLTDRGRRRMAEACRRVYDPTDDPWDGQWRVLCYSMPESMRTIRDDLRKELTWTGLAPLTPGTWISPNPLEAAIDELVRRYEIERYVTTFRASHTGTERPQGLVARCWDLAGIQAGYDRFIAQWQPLLGAGPGSDVACFVARIELVHDYRKFLFVDPGLPRELLPDRWRGHDARRLFQDCYRLLAPGARRFMDAAFEPTL
ncbi:MAG: transcriptional regulatory protein repressor-type [Symbiobacteriaceae bacterium]|jgi:phenylacetic acid degradation operon negative regulatory protein|nr:transcriptional regulatory protein repressor-type [Symbiobacteriaceae bacterium]